MTTSAVVELMQNITATSIFSQGVVFVAVCCKEVLKLLLLYIRVGWGGGIIMCWYSFMYPSALDVGHGVF